MPVFVDIKPSDSKTKKYTATFYHRVDGLIKKIKTSQFGAKGYADFTTHKDEERKKRYLDRHRARENWNDYKSAGSLSRFILWNKPTIKASIADYKKKFNLKSLSK